MGDPDPTGSSAAGEPGTVPVLLHRLDPSVPVPRYAYPGDAGVDLVTVEDVTLAPGRRETVRTGLAVALPEGYAGFVLPRSGLAARSGVTVVNAPGTVDAGYRGEVQVTLLNTDLDREVVLARGDRIAQLVVMPVPSVRFVEVDALPGSLRAGAGFGSSGTSGLPPSARSGSGPDAAVGSPVGTGS